MINCVLEITVRLKMQDVISVVKTAYKVRAKPNQEKIATRNVVNMEKKNRNHQWLCRAGLKVETYFCLFLTNTCKVEIIKHTY